MADGVIQTPQIAGPSVAKQIDATEFLRPDGTLVERQRVQLGDDDTSVQNIQNSLYVIALELKEIKQLIKYILG